MKFIVGALVMAVLIAGCETVSDLEIGIPTFKAVSSKPPKDYAECLAPAWQDRNKNVAATETESGYRVFLKIDMGGTPVMATASAQGEGSLVKVYVRNSTWNNWVAAAKNCL